MPDVDALVRALRAADLRVEALAPFGDWTCLLQVDPVPGLSGTLMIREAGPDALEAAFTCSVTADTGTRTAEIERLLARADRVALPARLFLFRDELGFSVHGGCREADLEALALEFVLIGRRACAFVLAPLAAWLAGEISHDEASALLETATTETQKGDR